MFNSLLKNLSESFDALRTNEKDLNYLRNFRSC